MRMKLIQTVLEQLKEGHYTRLLCTKVCCMEHSFKNFPNQNHLNCKVIELL